MPKFNCSYAYDVPCYFDLVVEADTEADALKKLEDALENKKFADCSAPPCWDNAPENQRVFVMGEAEPDAEVDDLDNLKS